MHWLDSSPRLPLGLLKKRRKITTLGLKFKLVRSILEVRTPPPCTPTDTRYKTHTRGQAALMVVLYLTFLVIIYVIVFPLPFFIGAWIRDALAFALRSLFTASAMSCPVASMGEEVGHQADNNTNVEDARIFVIGCLAVYFCVRHFGGVRSGVRKFLSKSRRDLRFPISAALVLGGILLFVSLLIGELLVSFHHHQHGDNRSVIFNVTESGGAARQTTTLLLLLTRLRASIARGLPFTLLTRLFVLVLLSIHSLRMEAMERISRRVVSTVLSLTVYLVSLRLAEYVFLPIALASSFEEGEETRGRGATAAVVSSLYLARVLVAAAFFDRLQGGIYLRLIRGAGEVWTRMKQEWRNDKYLLGWKLVQ